MSIYMKPTGISGNVTARDYRGWIQIESIQQQLHRPIKQTTVGDGHNRDYSLPRVPGMELTKHTDSSSSQLCHYFFSGKTIPQVNIVMTNHQGDTPYLTYTLYNVMIGRFNRFHDATLNHPIETLELSYTKLEERFVPYDAAQRSGTPVATGYDLSTAQVM